MMSNPSSPLNIVFISDDQHRYDHMEMWDRFPVRTPNMRRLAEEGVWHRATYSDCPLCMPARCCMHTGLQGHQNGLTTNVGHWPLNMPMMPQVLRRHGYHTAAIGKLHVYEGIPEKIDLTDPEVEARTRSLGYDHVHEVCGKSFAWFVDCNWTHMLRDRGLLEKYRELSPKGPAAFPLPEELYIDRYVGDHVVEWIDHYEGDQPFFLWAGYCSPHPPYDAPQSLLDHYPPEEQPLPLDNEDPQDWPFRRALYSGMVEAIDIEIGRLLDALERKGVLDNTLILFVGDHGEMLGEHGMDGKCIPYDPSSRVPCLARCPSLIEPGTVSDALMQIIDLTATCVEVATGDSDMTAHLPGSPAKSLIEHWANPAEKHRDYVYSEDGGQFLPPYQMIRDERWKYVLYTADGGELLFDMAADPHEQHNLADDAAHLTVKDELKSRLLSHLAETPTPLRD